MITVHTLNSTILDTNCYVIENDNSLIVIDPCVKEVKISNKFSKKIEMVLLTHAHFDHIIYLQDYANLNIPIYMHKNAYDKISDSNKNLSSLFDHRVEIITKRELINFVYQDYIIKTKNGDEIRTLYTPGHSDCSVCYLIDKFIFTGDTIFNNSVGRTDLYSGNEFQLMKSIQSLSRLNQDLIIFPGHGESTVLRYELTHNKLIKERYLKNYNS